MDISHKISDRIVWIATVFLFSSITIFESYTWGKYILILTCLFILCIDILEGNMKYRYTKSQIPLYNRCLSLFYVYSYGIHFFEFYMGN